MQWLRTPDGSRDFKPGFQTDSCPDSRTKGRRWKGRVGCRRVRVLASAGTESGVDIDTDADGAAIVAGTFGTSLLDCGSDAGIVLPI